jgi:uncharacterized protein
MRIFSGNRMIPSKPEPKTTPIPSPCVRQCCLNNEDVCIGCGRLLSEIIGWLAFSCEQQKNVIDLACKRLKVQRELFE